MGPSAAGTRFPDTASDPGCLRQLPMPASTNTGVAYFPTLSDAGTAVGAIIGAGIVPGHSCG
jgi:hypothetical protein